jgi:hypothetical protein
MATRTNALERDPELGPEWLRLRLESERLRAQHADIHGRAVDISEHRWHRTQLARHTRDIRAFRDRLRARRTDRPEEANA